MVSKNTKLKSSVCVILACVLLKTSWHTGYRWYNNIYFKTGFRFDRFNNFLCKRHPDLIQGTICFRFSGSCDEKLVLDENELFSFPNKVFPGSKALLLKDLK